MNLTELLRDFENLGVRFSRMGGDDIAVDAPKGTLTIEFVETLRKHKRELLAKLPVAEPIESGHVVIAPIEGAATASPWPLAGQQPTFTHGEDCGFEVFDPEPVELGPDGWPSNWIAGDTYSPCPKCGSMDQWESVTGDLFGRTLGRWRCMKCDPPKTSQRLFTKAEALRRKMELEARQDATKRRDRPGSP